MINWLYWIWASGKASHHGRIRWGSKLLTLWWLGKKEREGARVPISLQEHLPIQVEDLQLTSISKGSITSQPQAGSQAFNTWTFKVHLFKPWQWAKIKTHACSLSLGLDFKVYFKWNESDNLVCILFVL
jgi:hypothetical protein